MAGRVVVITRKGSGNVAGHNAGEQLRWPSGAEANPAARFKWSSHLSEVAMFPHNYVSGHHALDRHELWLPSRGGWYVSSFKPSDAGFLSVC